jgi:hypothetical protein
MLPLTVHLDHQKLLDRSRDELRRFRNALRKRPRRRFVIDHSPDDSCCRAEPWPATIGRVLRVLGIRGVFVANRIAWEEGRT